jgi:hypothetical protein
MAEVGKGSTMAQRPVGAWGSSIGQGRECDRGLDEGKLGQYTRPSRNGHQLAYT